jgi:hypothetical protein
MVINQEEEVLRAMARHHKATTNQLSQAKKEPGTKISPKPMFMNL